MGKKKRMGRPPLGPKKKSEIVRVRVTKAELRRLRSEAKKRGTTVAELLIDPWRQEEE